MLRERIAEHADPVVGQLVRSLERGTSRLVRLVDNLLESLRIDAGRDSIRRHAVALDDVIEEAVEQTAPLIEQKGQSLDVRLPFPLPGLVGDRPRLVQVFTNLLANANKFARQGSSVTVGGDVAEGEVTIWVEDEGPGFPEELVERPFERFSRAGGEEPEERGLGLGLWIANSIVERHGGRLVARNTGSGARVDVSLPRA
jgi:signal transduction histidine kinase